MQVNISSKHMQVTPAIEEYASKKIEKFPRYFNRATRHSSPTATTKTSTPASTWALTSQSDSSRTTRAEFGTISTGPP
ncbi:MAG: HPF/RaiA family ribosome-associated protein [Planctomycetota bacterium]